MPQFNTKTCLITKIDTPIRTY